MPVSPLTNALALLEQFGFFQVILPLILIYAIFYGILLRTKIFGEHKQEWVKPVSAVVSLAAAFFVVGSTEVVANINAILPQSAFIIVIAVILLMLLAMFGIVGGDKGFEERTPIVQWIIAGIIIFIFLGVIDLSLGLYIPVVHEIALALAGTTPGGAPLTEDALTTLIGLLLVLGIPAALIWWMVSAKSSTSP